jgi:hypothetical protein
MALSAELDFDDSYRYPSSHYYLWKGKLPIFPDELVIDIPEIELPDINEIEIDLRTHEKEMKELQSKLEKLKRSLNKKLRRRLEEEGIRSIYLHKNIEKELPEDMLELKKYLKNRDLGFFIKKKVPDNIIIVRTT